MASCEKTKTLVDFLLPLAILIPVSIIFHLTDLDLTLLANFYDPTLGWRLGDSFPWRQLYNYGTIPATVLAGGALLTLLSSLFAGKTVPFRRQALFLVLLMAIGPGLMVNVIFKDHWGRPRPREIQRFAGEQHFLPVWSKGVDGNGYSFPSGHASMGFYLVAPYFILRRRRPGMARLFLGGGLGAGIMIGAARMVQGGHFASDVLWSGGFVYLSGMALYHLLLKGKNEDATAATP